MFRREFTIITCILLVLRSRCSQVRDALGSDDIYLSHFCPAIGACPEGSHIMCMYHNPIRTTGPRCYEAVDVELTNEIRTYILNVTNTVREKLSKGIETGKNNVKLKYAYGMSKLQWDEELATFAQMMTNQCILRHDLCRASYRFYQPGQTVGLVRFTYPDWKPVSKKITLPPGAVTHAKVMYATTQVLNSWYDNKKHVTQEMLDNCPDWSRDDISTAGKVYLEMVYYAATHVGCGVVGHTDYAYHDNNADVIYNTIQIICNFSDKPKTGREVYISKKPNSPGYTVRCGCPYGYEEDAGCLCTPIRRIGTCPAGAKNCGEVPMVILPIITIEDAPQQLKKSAKRLGPRYTPIQDKPETINEIRYDMLRLIPNDSSGPHYELIPRNLSLTRHKPSIRKYSSKSQATEKPIDEVTTTKESSEIQDGEDSETLERSIVNEEDSGSQDSSKSLENVNETEDKTKDYESQTEQTEKKETADDNFAEPQEVESTQDSEIDIENVQNEEYIELKNIKDQQRQENIDSNLLRVLRNDFKPVLTDDLTPEKLQDYSDAYIEIWYDDGVISQKQENRLTQNLSNGIQTSYVNPKRDTIMRELISSEVRAINFNITSNQNYINAINKIISIVEELKNNFATTIAQQMPIDDLKLKQFFTALDAFTVILDMGLIKDTNLTETERYKISEMVHEAVGTMKIFANKMNREYKNQLIDSTGNENLMLPYENISIDKNLVFSYEKTLPSKSSKKYKNKQFEIEHANEHISRHGKLENSYDLEFQIPKTAYADKYLHFDNEKLNKEHINDQTKNLVENTKVEQNKLIVNNRHFDAGNQEITTHNTVGLQDNQTKESVPKLKTDLNIKSETPHQGLPQGQYAKLIDNVTVINNTPRRSILEKPIELKNVFDAKGNYNHDEIESLALLEKPTIALKKLMLHKQPNAQYLSPTADSSVKFSFQNQIEPRENMLKEILKVVQFRDNVAHASPNYIEFAKKSQLPLHESSQIKQLLSQKDTANDFDSKNNRKPFSKNLQSKELTNQKLFNFSSKSQKINQKNIFGKIHNNKVNGIWNSGKGTYKKLKVPLEKLMIERSPSNKEPNGEQLELEEGTKLCRMKDKKLICDVRIISNNQIEENNRKGNNDLNLIQKLKNKKSFSKKQSPRSKRIVKVKKISPKKASATVKNKKEKSQVKNHLS